LRNSRLRRKEKEKKKETGKTTQRYLFHSAKFYPKSKKINRETNKYYKN